MMSTIVDARSPSRKEAKHARLLIVRLGVDGWTDTLDAGGRGEAKVNL